MARRRRTTENSRKDGVVVWEMLEHVRRDDRSTTQVVGNMKREGKPMLHGLTCWYVRADGSEKPAGHCRHGMKYGRHGRPDRTVKRGTSPVAQASMTSRRRRTADAPANRRRTRQRAGTAGTFTERPANFILMEKFGHGREAALAAKTTIRLSFPYRGDGVKTMMTDNGSKFPAHGKITEAMKGTAACFADPCSSWQKVPLETPTNS